MTYAHSSTAIEGNPLTLEQVHAVEAGEAGRFCAMRVRVGAYVPPPEQVPGLMLEFLDWWNNGAPVLSWLEYSAEGLQQTLERTWQRIQQFSASASRAPLVLRPKQEQLLQMLRARRFSRNEVRKGVRPYTGEP